MIQRLEYLWQELRQMLANTKREVTKISGKCGITTEAETGGKREEGQSTCGNEMVSVSV